MGQDLFEMRVETLECDNCAHDQFMVGVFEKQWYIKCPHCDQVTSFSELMVAWQLHEAATHPTEQ